jgi:hypothetical protein
MDEKEIKGFSWTSFFFVTGVSFLVFNGLMRLLDEMPIRLFLKIGLVATGLGVLSFLNDWLSKKFMGSGARMPSQQKQAV